MATDDLTTHETKAIRMMVLYRLRAEGQLSGLSDIALGEAFEVDRITIWKDKQALKRADKLYARILAKAPWGDHVPPSPRPPRSSGATPRRSATWSGTACCAPASAPTNGHPHGRARPLPPLIRPNAPNTAPPPPPPLPPHNERGGGATAFALFGPRTRRSGRIRQAPIGTFSAYSRAKSRPAVGAAVLAARQYSDGLNTATAAGRAPSPPSTTARSGRPPVAGCPSLSPRPTVTHPRPSAHPPARPHPPGSAPPKAGPRGCASTTR